MNDQKDNLDNVLAPFLSRKDPEAQRELANHPLTRAFLEAGIRLLEEEFVAGPAAKKWFRRRPRPFLWMSRGQIVKKITRGPKGLSRKGGDGSFRDRWSYVSDYLGDLIRYALRIYRWGDRTDLAEQAADAIGKGDLSTVVHEITYRDIKFMTDDMAMRLLFLVTAFADRDPVIAEALSAVYRKVTEAWGGVYTDFFHTRDLRLRPGLSMDDFTVLLTAVAEGLALRAIADRATPVLDAERRHSLLGTAVLALVIACVDPGDGGTLEEAANRIADPR